MTRFDRPTRWLESCGDLQNAGGPERGLDNAAAGVEASQKERTRLVVVSLVIWLLIGAVAAGQRHYYSGSTTNCAKVGTVTVAILAGPLNYLGVNPRISCEVPQPSN